MSAPLPNFILGGASKSGTTSLAFYLEEHPDIAISRPKEAHFFDSDARVQRGPDDYRRHFEHVTTETAVGDATPAYLHGSHIAERIDRTLPGCRAVFIFRDPVKRAYSNYWHGIARGRALPPFARCIDRDDCRHIWERSRYAKYLRVYVDIFGRDRVHWLLTEQLAAEPRPTLGALYRFLGVDPSFENARVGERRNTNRVPRSLWLQRVAYRYFAPGSKPEEVSHFDEQGTLVYRQVDKGPQPVRRALFALLARVNPRPGSYPPMSDEEEPAPCDDCGEPLSEALARTIRLTVECIEAYLKDLGEPWLAMSRPAHAID